MRRKKLITAGLLLSMNYALLLIAAFCALITMLAYTLLDTVDIASDILNAIIAPFQIGDNMMNLIFVGSLTVAFIYLVVAATRISKYSKYNQTMFERKKGFAIVYLLSFMIASGGYAFWLVTNIQQSGFENFLPVNITLIATLFIHLVSILLMIIEYIKGFASKRTFRN